MAALLVIHKIGSLSIAVYQVGKPKRSFSLRGQSFCRLYPENISSRGYISSGHPIVICSASKRWS